MKKPARRFAVVRSRSVGWLIVAGLSIGAGTVTAKEGETKASPSEPPQLAVVLNVERPSKADLLLLRSGEQLTGVLLNETFTLRTSYAELKLERRMLAGIDLNDGARGIESIITINSNRFSGFIEDPFFAFQDPTGSRTDVRREKVLKVIFGAREAELHGIPQGRWIRLKNGDGFSGQLLVDPLPLVTASGQVPIGLKEAASLKFTTGAPPQTKIILRSGDVQEGTLAIEDLPIQLDVGPKIQLYRDRIDTIGDRLVPDTTTLAATQHVTHPDASSAVASASSRTNFEGMVWIPAGEFIMGSPTDEVGRDQDEGPQTRVMIAQGFWMGRCEVTQAEYQSVMGTNPSNLTGDPASPVEKVSWLEAVEYCTKLTQRARATGRLPEGYAYRLPTEAEWEYACRAGTTTRYSYGDDKSYTQLGDYAWFTGNSDSTKHPVGTRRPNPWGLFDMHGNVWEWCLDRWQGFLPGSSLTNLPGPAEGALRVARGGSWLYDAKICRSANRDDYSPSNRCSDLGFRVVLAPSQP
ncbi:MAG: formylglycine-generating enzyme family protein [Verrucomicrobia bacterium]|nr:formylglycine-generating enzyme family protein [Verrucomicrobiota bacterium]